MSWSRDHFRGNPVTLQDVASAAPWRAVPVAGLEPIVLTLGGPPLRLCCSDLAAYAGLDANPRGWPQPGALAGAVVIADTFTSALIPGPYCETDRLCSHQLMSLLFHAGDVLELRAAKPGTVRLWLCVASGGALSNTKTDWT